MLDYHQCANIPPPQYIELLPSLDLLLPLIKLSSVRRINGCFYWIFFIPLHCLYSKYELYHHSNLSFFFWFIAHNMMPSSSSYVVAKYKFHCSKKQIFEQYYNILFIIYKYTHSISYPFIYYSVLGLFSYFLL